MPDPSGMEPDSPDMGPDGAVSGETADHVRADQDGAVPGGTTSSARPDAAEQDAHAEGHRADNIHADNIQKDGKDAGAFRTIGEVTRALGIAPHVLRYWEEQFPMLRPVKRSGGRRYYRPEDIALLEDIHRLVHRQGYTLRGARQFLETQLGQRQGKKPRSTAVVAQTSLASPSLLEGLIALRHDLASLLKG